MSSLDDFVEPSSQKRKQSDHWHGHHDKSEKGELESIPSMYYINPPAYVVADPPKPAAKPQEPKEILLDDISLDAVLESAIQESDELMLKGMIQQFERPYLYIRELVQNAVDAGASEVKITLGRDERSGYGTICVEDNGNGMDIETVRHYFLKLFESSKEKDLSTIGRFGVGLVSVFMQDPELLQVETAKRGHDPLKLLIGKVKYGAPGKILKPKQSSVGKGTKLTLYVKLDEKQMDDVRTNLREELDSYCAYLPTPILFEGEAINKEFDIDAPIKVKIGGQGLEAILALTGKSSYALMNHRMVLLHGNSFTDTTGDLEMFINSKYFNPTISRNAVMQDKKYDHIKKKIDKERIQLVRKAFKYMEEDAQHRKVSFVGTTFFTYPEAEREKRIQQSTMVWEYGWKYLSSIAGNVTGATAKKRLAALEKSIDAEVLDTSLFLDYNDKKVTLRQIIDAVRKHGKIYFGDRDHLSKQAEAAGYLVLKPYAPSDLKNKEDRDAIDTKYNIYSRILSVFGPMRHLEKEFMVSQQMSRNSLSDENRQFIEQVNAALQENAPLHKAIERIEFGNFSIKYEMRKAKGLNIEERVEQPMPPYTSMKNNTLLYSEQYSGRGSRRLKAERMPIKERIRRFFYKNDTILLNERDSYIRSVMDAGNDRPARITELLNILAVEKDAERPGLAQQVYAAQRKVSA
jgi:hypothetical protein